MALLQRGVVGADLRRGRHRMIPVFVKFGRMRLRVVKAVGAGLALALGAACLSAQQPSQQKEQTRQNQRLLFGHVYRHDQETMLEDPAIANQVTNEGWLPESNEQNVESRELTLDDFHRQRFVPVPVAGEGMQFVPGKGYVAGRTEEATEPGLSVLAPVLGFETRGGALSHSAVATPPDADIVSDDDSSPRPGNRDDPYAQAPDPLLGLDPFNTTRGKIGIDSALDRRPPANPPFADSHVGNEWQIEPLSRTNINDESTKGKRGSTAGQNSRPCEFKVDPRSVHDREELRRLTRQGCLARGNARGGKSANAQR